MKLTKSQQKKADYIKIQLAAIQAQGIGGCSLDQDPYFPKWFGLTLNNEAVIHCSELPFISGYLAGVLKGLQLSQFLTKRF